MSKNFPCRTAAMLECPKLLSAPRIGLTLRIEHGGLEGNVYASLHITTLQDRRNRRSKPGPECILRGPPGNQPEARIAHRLARAKMHEMHFN